MIAQQPKKRSIADHLCNVCRIPCGFGLGFDEQAKWFCRAHLPPGFLPADRAEAAVNVVRAASASLASATPPPLPPASAPPVTETPKPPPAPARVEAKPQKKPEKPADPSQGSLF